VPDSLGEFDSNIINIRNIPNDTASEMHSKIEVFTAPRNTTHLLNSNSKFARKQKKKKIQEKPEIEVTLTSIELQYFPGRICKKCKLPFCCGTFIEINMY
jgi:hypothetical protein